MEVLLGCGAGRLSSGFNFDRGTEKRDAGASRFSFRNKEGILDHSFYDLIVPVPISSISLTVAL